MEKWRFVEDEEFDREFADVCERVFGPVFWSGFWGDDWDDAEDSLFADPAWRVTLLPQTPFYWYCPEDWIGEGGERRRPEIYKRGARAEGYPPIKSYFASYFEPFCLTLAELGIDEVVVTTRDDVGVKGADGRYHGYSAGEFTEDGYRLYKPIHGVLRPTLEVFLDAEFDDDVDFVGGGIFSRDGNWGRFRSPACRSRGSGFRGGSTGRRNGPGRFRPRAYPGLRWVFPSVRDVPAPQREKFPKAKRGPRRSDGR